MSGKKGCADVADSSITAKRSLNRLGLTHIYEHKASCAMEAKRETLRKVSRVYLYV
jgi:hypothetical protein